MEPEALYEKNYNGLLLTTSNEYIWPKKILIFMHGLKSAIFLAIFQEGCGKQYDIIKFFIKCFWLCPPTYLSG